MCTDGAKLVGNEYSTTVILESAGLYESDRYRARRSTLVSRQDIHPRKQQMNGEKVLLEFQSCVRREWFDALRRDEGFNIEPQRPRRPLESHRRGTERYFRKTMHQFCATLQE